MDLIRKEGDETFSKYCLNALKPLLDPPLVFGENSLPLKRTRSSSVKCKCRKSKCVKLYCDCFSWGQYCVDCGCVNCFNKQEHAKFRNHSIRKVLHRNPQAFSKPRKCTCRKIHCKEKYCACFTSGKKCDDDCKCINCLNT